jgi:hypothetical protein
MYELIPQFNRFSQQERQNILRKALTSATNVGEALIPQVLGKAITDLVVRLSPEIAIITTKGVAGKTYEFNRRLTLPQAGAALGEAATTPTYNSTIQRDSLTLKVIRRKGAVTNFLQDTSRDYIDSAAAELEAHIQAHVYDLVTYLKFGNATGDALSFNGWDNKIATNRKSADRSGTQTRGGYVPTSLAFLNDMIDANRRRQGALHRNVIIMSPEMASKVSELLTNVRLNQNTGGGLGTIDIQGGWRLESYRGIPIIESGSCRPQSTMGTVTPSVQDSGGTISDNQTVYYQVAAVTWDGEQLASAEVSQSSGSGGAGNVHCITLTWTAVTNAVMYKIYASTTTGTEVLVAEIPAKVTDSTGTPVASTTMTSNTKVLTSDANCNTISCKFVSTPSTAGTEIPTARQTDKPLVATGGIPPEYIFFIDLDEVQGMGLFPYTNADGTRFNGLVTVTPLAITDDNLPFLVKSYCGMVDAFEATCSVIRDARVQ